MHLKKGRFNRFLCAVTFALACFTGLAHAERDSLRPILVGDCVRIALPHTWHESNGDERRTVDISAKEALSNGRAVFAASAMTNLVSESADGAVIVRVTLADGTGETQSDWINAAQQRPVEMLEALRAKAVASMENANRVGLKVWDPQVSFKVVGGKFAAVMTFKRASTDGAGNWTVTQYLVPLGEKQVMISVNRRDDAAAIWDPVLQRIQASIEFVAAAQPG